MGPCKRIADIISANLNALTEQFEDPERMLRQAIREMEETIAEATREAAKSIASQRLMARELVHHKRQSGEWQDRARKAVASGDDDHTREALRRKQEHDKLAAALSDQGRLADEADEAARSLRRQLDGMKAKLAEAKRSLSTLAARQRAADFRKKLAATTADASFSHDASAFAQFDRFREKVERAEAEAEAFAELHRRQTDARETESLTAQEDPDIEAQLNALKEQMKTRFPAED